MSRKDFFQRVNWLPRSREYDLADDAYGAFIRQYSRSPSIPRARLRQAYAAYAQFHGPRFEATPAIDAREQLSAIMQQYPKLAADENIAPLLGDIDSQLAKKLYITADFYRRTHKPSAAVYYYRYLMGSYPDLREAQTAAQRVSQMPQWAQNQAPPPTRPSAASTRAASKPATAGRRLAHLTPRSRRPTGRAWIGS